MKPYNIVILTSIDKAFLELINFINTFIDMGADYTI